MRRSQRLNDLVARAKTHKMTPQQRHKQRASLIMGLRGDDSTLTRKKVETLLKEMEGSPA
jgi:hypothetical protein